MAHILDITLAVILILRALRGWTRGAISGIASLIGLIGGVWVGLWASGDIVSRITNNSSSDLGGTQFCVQHMRGARSIKHAC